VGRHLGRRLPRDTLHENGSPLVDPDRAATFAFATFVVAALAILSLYPEADAAAE